MSVLIKGMDMPKNCRHCDFTHCTRFGEKMCTFLNEATSIKHKLPDCPLVKVPVPHGRLIDADAHIQSLRENQCGERCRKNHDCVNCGIGMYIQIVEDKPTILKAGV